MGGACFVGSGPRVEGVGGVGMVLGCGGFFACGLCEIVWVLESGGFFWGSFLLMLLASLTWGCDVHSMST